MKQVKKWLASLLVGAMVVGSAFTVQAAGENPYSDLVNDNTTSWYYDYAISAYENGYMTGMPDGNDGIMFGANETLTREMFATTLFKKDTKDAIKLTNSEAFSDVTDDNAWYTSAIMWASKEGIVNGIGGTDTFGVGQNINRAMIATMLYRYANYKGYDTAAQADLTTFPDAADVPTWASEGIAWAIEAGIITGTLDENNDTIINPMGEANRAQCATMLMRFVNKYGTEGDGAFYINSTDAKTEYDIWATTLKTNSYYPEFVDGKNITVTVELSSDNAFGGVIGMNAGEDSKWTAVEQINGSAGNTVTWKASFENASGYPQIQIYWMNGEKVEVKSVKIEETVEVENTLAGYEAVLNAEGTEYISATVDGITSVEEYASVEVRSTNWGGSLNLGKLTDTSYVVVEYTSDNTPKFVLNGDWTEIPVSYATKNAIVVSYKDMAAVVDDVSTFGSVCIQAQNVALDVTSIRVVEYDGDIDADYAAVIAADGTEYLSEATSTGGNYGIIQLKTTAWDSASTLNTTLFTDNHYVLVTYTGDVAPQLSLQDVDNEKWISIPAYVKDNVAIFSYTAMKSTGIEAFGALNIQDTGSDIPVTSIKVVEYIAE